MSDSEHSAKRSSSRVREREQKKADARAKDDKDKEDNKAKEEKAKDDKANEKKAKDDKASERKAKEGPAQGSAEAGGTNTEPSAGEQKRPRGRPRKKDSNKDQKHASGDADSDDDAPSPSASRFTAEDKEEIARLVAAALDERQARGKTGARKDSALTKAMSKLPVPTRVGRPTDEKGSLDLLRSNLLPDTGALAANARATDLLLPASSARLNPDDDDDDADDDREETHTRVGADLGLSDRVAPRMLQQMKPYGSLTRWCSETKFSYERNRYECATLCRIADHLLADGYAVTKPAMEILFRRIAGVQTADDTGDWTSCDVLDVYSTHGSLLPRDDYIRTLKLAAQIKKLRAGGTDGRKDSGARRGTTSNGARRTTAATARAHDNRNNNSANSNRPFNLSVSKPSTSTQRTAPATSTSVTGGARST